MPRIQLPPHAQPSKLFTKPSSNKPISASMDTINFISSLRQQALLLGDYNDYRRLCSRRLAKLRKQLGRATGPKRRDSKLPPAITAQDLNKDSTYAHLFLYSSERAWAHAMYMKASPTDAGERLPRATRDHVRSRLAKAVSHASQLSALYTDPEATAVTDKDIVEMAAYTASLAGTLAFEKGSWEDASKEFSIAKIAFDALAISSAAGAEVYKELLTSTVEPGIKYSTYQMGIPRVSDIGPLARHFFPKERDGGKLFALVGQLNPSAFSVAGTAAGGDEMEGVESAFTVNSVEWRGRMAVVENTDVAAALGAAQKAEHDFRSKFESGEDMKHSPENFDALLLAWQECVDETKKALDKAVAEGLSTGDPKVQNLQLIFTYVNYNLISWRIGRNRVMAADIEEGQKTAAKATQGKLKELLVLYDAILQSLDQITELPGVAADEGFGGELEAKRGYFAALRCSTIAASHTDARNTLALYNRALTYITSSLPLLDSSASTSPTSASTVRNLTISSSEATSLKTCLEAQVARYRGLIQLQDHVAKTAAAQSTIHSPLIGTLDTYNEKVNFKNLVPLPPQVEAIPVKPIFFDVAWNFVEYLGEEKRPAAEAQEKKEEEQDKMPRKGFLGGLFGR